MRQSIITAAPDSVAEHLQRAVLDVGVEGQHHLLAGDGRMSPAGSSRTTRPRDVDLDLLAARLAAQLQVQRLLDPLLADPEARVEQQRVGVGAASAFSSASVTLAT